MAAYDGAAAMVWVGVRCEGGARKVHDATRRRVSCRDTT